MVIDDAAVTPRYVVGFAAERELPIVGRIAVGSLRNKLLILLPVALALSFFAPWAVTPLLMLGAPSSATRAPRRCYEALIPHQAHAARGRRSSRRRNARPLEDEKVASAIKTDFILSAEIMAITLAAVPAGASGRRRSCSRSSALASPLAVYGGVALIVKADDVGLALARYAGAVGHWRRNPLARPRARPRHAGLPGGAGIVGTAAMIWVGGGIILHGIEQYGPPVVGHTVHAAAEAAAHLLPSIAGIVEWSVEAAISGVVGLLVGAVAIPAVTYGLSPLWKRLKRSQPT